MAAAVPEIETTASRLVYRNRWMRVREDSIRRQDGSSGIYGMVEKPDFAVIVPMEDDGSLHLVEQYRYPVAARFCELPQGSWETQPDAAPIAVARGELGEETGLEAGKMSDLGYLFAMYGHSSQGYRVFLAQDLRYVGVAREHEEQGLITRRFAMAEVIRMIVDGTIKDAATVAALGLLHFKDVMPH